MNVNLNYLLNRTVRGGLNYEAQRSIRSGSCGNAGVYGRLWSKGRGEWPESNGGSHTDGGTYRHGDPETDSNTGTYSAKYPVINVQRLITEFNMQSEMTAVIGGLSRTIETQKDNGIPWLRDIWWIGPKLFGSKVRVKEQKEIIVFVTVGIVDPKNIQKDAGLPKNAVLGRQYTEGKKLEPGDMPDEFLQGQNSIDIRSLEEQAKQPIKAIPAGDDSSRFIPFLNNNNKR